MIVLKQLAREYNVEPHTLRRVLRALNTTTTEGRWKWTPQQLTQIKKKLAKVDFNKLRIKK